GARRALGVALEEIVELRVSSAAAEQILLRWAVLRKLPNHPLRLRAAHPPRIVIRMDPARLDAPEDQRARPLRVRGGEQARHAAAFRDTEDHPLLAADRIHDRTDVFRPLLERRDFFHGIGEAGPALVEPDQT